MNRAHEIKPSNELPPTHLALYRRLATVFIVMTVLVAGLVFYVLWSRATVIVLSRQEEVRAEFIADISDEPTGAELAGLVTEGTDSAERSWPAAQAAKTDTHAEGRVEITSTLSRPQTLVATTRLLTTDQKLYRLKDRVIVPANGSIEADIFSDGVGSEFDLTEASFTIPGLNPTLRQQFTVKTVGPVTGGQRITKLVTKAEVESASESMKDELVKDLTKKLRKKAEEAGLSATGEIIDVQLVSQDVKPAIGTEAEDFSLSVKIKATGIFFNRKQLNRLAEARVKEIVPFGRRLLELEDEATAISVEKTDLASGRANLRVSALGTAVLSTDAPALDPTKLTGVTDEAAVDYLEQINGVASASVKLSPFWSSRLPSVSDNIKIEVR